MKKLYSLLVLFTIITQTSAQQVSSVDSNNPISSVKYYYNNLGNLEISVTLSEIKKETVEEEGFLNPDDFIFKKLNATIDWQSKSLKKQIEISLQNQSDNKFKYSAIFEVKDGNNTFPVKKEIFKGKASEHKWNQIRNVSISYEIGGVIKTLPLFDISPEIPQFGDIEYSLSVVDPGVIYDKQSGFITLKTEPLPISGTLTSLKLSKGAAILNLSPNIQSQNGIYKVPLLNTAVNLEEGTWLIEAIVDIEESGISNAKTKSDASIFLISKPKPKVTNISDKFFVDANGKNTIDIKVQTTGIGDIRLDFIPNISESFKIPISSQKSETGLYTFTLSNLNNLPKDRTIYFNIVDGDGKPLTKGPHLFISTTPKLDNFAIDVSKGESKIKFDLPNTVEGSSISVRLDDLGISATGSNNIKELSGGDTGNLKSWEANFGGVGFSKLYENIKKDSIIESSLSVLVAGNTVYNIKLKFVNQDYINKKLKELAEISSEKVKKKELDDKKEKIKKTLTEIVSVVGKLDEVVSNEEVSKTVDTLAEGGDKEKTSKVMETIGKVGSWVGTLGPIVIPLLL